MRLSLRSPVAPRHLPMLVLAIFLGISAIGDGIQNGWVGAAIPLVIMLLTAPVIIVEKWARIRIPFSLQLLYAILLLTGPYLGGHVGMYQGWDPWDKWVHLYSGLPVSLGVVLLLGIIQQRYRITLPLWLEVVLVLSIKATVALWWEIVEFLFDEVFDAEAQDHNFDTMTDVILGMVFGVVVSAALVLHRTKGWFSYLGFLLNFPQPSLPSHLRGPMTAAAQRQAVRQRPPGAQ